MGTGILGTFGVVVLILVIIANAFRVDKWEKEKKLALEEAERKLDKLGSVDYMTLTFSTWYEASKAQDRVEKQRREQGKGFFSSPGIRGDRETGFRLVD